MKTILAALFLVTLASCDSSNDRTQTRSCSFNGQPVDCDALSSKPVSTSNRNVKVLKATVVSAIEVTPTEFRYLEHQEDEALETRDGEELGCAVFTNTDEVIGYTVKGQSLTLTRENEKVVLTRISGQGWELKGLWSMKEKDEFGESTFSFEFFDGKVRVTQECSFK